MLPEETGNYKVYAAVYNALSLERLRVNETEDTLALLGIVEVK
jgi:hypothetical protein